ncbi:hypothetical protein [Micromonospora sp. NPDC126480]|uniref:hypothetical protein n=1 Tax=Micromonospora sp. NPDC126480 TaxID=3155312 RepID=UPI00331F726E
MRDPARVADLETAVAALLDTGAEPSEPTRVRAPVGFTDAGAAARFVVRDGFHVTHRLPHPATIGTGDFVGWCADTLAPYAPGPSMAYRPRARSRLNRCGGAVGSPSLPAGGSLLGGHQRFRRNSGGSTSTRSTV